MLSIASLGEAGPVVPDEDEEGGTLNAGLLEMFGGRRRDVRLISSSVFFSIALVPCVASRMRDRLRPEQITLRFETYNQLLQRLIVPVGVSGAYQPEGELSSTDDEEYVYFGKRRISYLQADKKCWRSCTVSCLKPEEKHGVRYAMWEGKRVKQVGTNLRLTGRPAGTKSHHS